MNVQPFRVNVSQETLDDLQLGLGALAVDAIAAGWDYGTSLDYLKRTYQLLADTV